MGKLNVRVYLTLRFYATGEIRKQLLRAKNMRYSNRCILSFTKVNAAHQAANVLNEVNMSS